MTIIRSDVKLMKSERLTDNNDGGGRMTKYEVQDGVANNLFPDISRLDRVYGRVSLRKAFLSVNTQNTDTYYGAHAIVSNPPEDDSVHTLLFTTNSPSDERATAENSIESYLVKAFKTALRLLGDHLQGQSVMTCFAYDKGDIPMIGDVVVLVQGAQEQYMRILDMDVTSQVFSYLDNSNNLATFSGRKIVFQLNQLFAHTFTGNEPHPTAAAVTSVYTTSIANASRYYGVTTLADNAVIGEKALTVSNVFRPIVPITNKENIIADTNPFQDDLNMMAIGAEGSFTKSLGTTLSAGKTFYMGIGIMPGTLRLTINSVAYKDRGGDIVPSNPLSDTGFSGTVEYATGKIYVQNGTSGYAISGSCTPAANVSGSKKTLYKEINSANAAFTHLFDIGDTDSTLPAAGTVTVEYLSFGKWYKLYDNGAGGLAGLTTGVGAGTVDYVTGLVSVTCAALPDIGSVIIVAWSPKNSACLLATPGYSFAGQKINFGYNSIHPGSVTLTWTNADGSIATATDNGAGGFADSDLTGEIAFAQLGWHDGAIQNYIGPHVTMFPTKVPNKSVPISVTFNEGTPSMHFTGYNNAITPPADPASSFTFNIGQAGIIPGTVVFAVRVRRPFWYRLGYGGVASYVDWLTVRTRANGSLYADLRDVAHLFYPAYYSLNFLYTGKTIEIPGSINFVTGAVEMTIHNVFPKYWYEVVNGYWLRTASDAYETFDGYVSWSGTKSSAPGTAHTLSVPWDAPKFFMTSFNNEIKPGSLRLQIGANLIYDLSGTLQYNISTSTGQGTTIGSINYDTGELVFTDLSLFGTGTFTPPTGLSVISQDGIRYPLNTVAFRTTGCPLVPQSLLIDAKFYRNGEAIAFDFAPDGTITETYHSVTGKVYFDSGVVVLKSGSSLFDIDSTSIRYSAVYLQNLPLDTGILGLDPTRLPPNGQIPIFRKADVIVVHHTGTYQCDQPIQGLTVNVGRTNLALVEVYDSNDVIVDPADYAANLAAGTVTFDNPFSATYSQPLRVLHRIEDMLLVTEVYINGKLETAGALSHDYPAVDTQVSSALLFGDLASRVLNMFSQTTWTSVWSDARIGSNTTAQFNDIDYPIVVQNDSAVEERWAIIFTSATAFNVVGETLGVIATGNTGADCAPLNSLTGKAYFTIPWHGWGSGWANGNVLRFNTEAAAAPLWLIRTTLAGPVEEPVDKFVLQLRGDAN